MFKNLKTLSGHLPLGTPSPIPQRFHRVLLSLFLKELFQIFDKGLVHKFLKNFLVNFNWVKLFVNKGIFCRRQFPQDVSCEVTLVTHLYIPKKSSKITFEISLRLFHFFFSKNLFNICIITYCWITCRFLQEISKRYIHRFSRNSPDFLWMDFVFCNFSKLIRFLLIGIIGFSYWCILQIFIPLFPHSQTDPCSRSFCRNTQKSQKIG